MEETIMTLEMLLDEIRALSMEERKRLISLIVDTLTEDVHKSQAHKKRSLLDFEGVGEEMWRGIDAQDYVNRLRDEWDQPR